MEMNEQNLTSVPPTEDPELQVLRTIGAILDSSNQPFQTVKICLSYIGEKIKQLEQKKADEPTNGKKRGRQRLTPTVQEPAQESNA